MMKISGDRQLCVLALIGSSLVMAGGREDGACEFGNQWLVARGYGGRCGSYPLAITTGRDAKHFAVPLPQRGNAGYLCQFNVDCLPGLACYKANFGAVEGRCARPEPADDPSGR